MQGPQSGALGLLGGAFDPVHHGHLRMAIECCERLHLQQVLLIPTGQPVHRDQAQATAQQRLTMLQLAIGADSMLGIEPSELEHAGPSYTFDTLTRLRQRHGPTKPLVWIIGLDAFLGLPSWHRWRELLQLCHLAVVHRPGSRFCADGHAELAAWLEQHRCQDAGTLLQQAGGQVLLLELPQLDIASSAIRTRLMQQQNIRHLLPEPVREFINTHNLYR